MPALDDAAIAAVSDFAADMGLGQMLHVKGAFSFDFAEAGRLSVLADDSGQHILVSLTRRIILTDLVGYGRVLRCAGRHATRERLIHAGVTSTGQPVLAIAGPRTGFDRSRLETEFTILREAFVAEGL